MNQNHTTSIEEVWLWTDHISAGIHCKTDLPLIIVILLQYYFMTKMVLIAASGLDLQKLRLQVNQTRGSFPLGTAVSGNKIASCYDSGSDDKVRFILALLKNL